MKYILITTLLVTGCAGNVFVFGQTREHMSKIGDDSIRIMQPDNMPCRVPNLAKTERMPVKKLDSRMVRPMPNGTPGNRPKVEIVPRRKPE